MLEPAERRHRAVEVLVDWVTPRPRAGCRARHRARRDLRPAAHHRPAPVVPADHGGGEVTTEARDLRCRVAIYARVSTEEQARKDEGSLDKQLHRCRQYLASVGHPHDVVDTARVYRGRGTAART